MQKRPLHFGKAWFPIFLPLLLIFGVLSIPYSWLLIVLGRCREQMLRGRMKAAGRLMSWEEFVPRLEEAQGTLIYEFNISGWPGGYFRLWWTPENAYSLYPYPWVDLETTLTEAEFSESQIWCRDRYTTPNGTAVLVAATKDQTRNLFESSKLFRHIPRHNMNWVDLCTATVGRRYLQTKA